MKMNELQPAVVFEVNGEFFTEEQMRERRTQALANLHGLFAKQRDEWVAFRAASGVESRWRRAEALYEGEDAESFDTAFVRDLKEGPRRRTNAPAQPRSTVVINIVRPKVDQNTARMCEILLPVDDRNWGIKPSPVPEQVQQLIGSNEPMVNRTTGQPVGMTGDQAAQAFIKKMKQSSDAMASEIDDCLSRCDYNGEQRKLIFDGVRLGTGMIIGPYPKNQIVRKWMPQQDGRLQLAMEATPTAASMHVSPWDIWFDRSCGNDHRRGAGFYHRRYATRRELRDLVGIPGFDPEVIRAVLRTKPTRTFVADGRVVHNPCDEDSYEMWVYYGDVDPEHMALISESTGDPLEGVSNGIVVMVNNQVVGALESWVPDGSLPIDVWTWRPDPNSPYGRGMPDELAHQQRVINASWRQLMDNARISLGSQIVLKKRGIVPQNGSYTVEPLKVWLADDELQDVKEAMASIDFPSHLQELLAIVEAAMKYADQETSSPQMLGGDKGNAPETLGGMVLLFNNTNVVTRYRVKRYDDGITRPHITRHFDWQMVNNPKREIKGDHEVSARGSTALLEKDIQNQATMNLANITTNPRYSSFLDAKEELKVILKAFRIQPEDIMLPDSVIDENQKKAAAAPPQDPNAIRAQAQLQIKEMDIRDKQEDRAFQERKQQAELAHKGAALQYNAQREESEREISLTEAAITRDVELLRAASDEQENQLEREARERLAALQIDSKHQMFNAEAALRVNTGAGI